ncbi:MAG: class I SAM-dependent methyltransferase, partial [Phycisphaerales bacterium]
GCEGKTLVEIGSGGGFLKEAIPGVITSDILDLPNVDRCFSALKMPFGDGTVDAFFMVDVLHHIPDAREFLGEMQRCLKVGGRVAMIEPANTAWARFIYRNLIDEPFDPQGDWSFPQQDRPVSAANIALPWIVFTRDRERFELEFPSYNIVKLELHTPLRYLVSGGLSVRQLVPSFTYPLVKAVEAAVSPFTRYLAMFQTVVLQKGG